MNTRFDILATPIPGLQVLQRKPIGDSRGYLERLFCAEELQPFISGKHIVQINHTLTRKKGAVRGLHFQHPPHAETKLVSCLKGEIWDVAVDIRSGSPTFLQWHGEILSEANRKSMLIPEGFAHGFQALTGDCELIYLHTAAYHPEAEGALNVADPRISISWTLPIGHLSERDRNHSFINREYQGIVL